MGKEGAKRRAMLSHWIPPGSCPVSLVLRAVSPEKEHNGLTPPGYFPGFLIQRAGQLCPSMSHSIHEVALSALCFSHHLSCALRQGEEPCLGERGEGCFLKDLTRGTI